MPDSALSPSLNAAIGPTGLVLSVVIPIYNEYDSIPLLVDQVGTVLTEMNLPYELICVDDGSTDGSADLLRQIASRRQDLQVVILRRNYGQSAAMAAGFNYAAGRVIVTLDGDLQNEPADIATVFHKLEQGYDLVSGWRQSRQDNTLTRLLPSKLANWLIGKVTGIELHDYGCSLKAYRAEVAHDMHLYGELHRFLPALAFIEGARITEIPVRHHARRFGQSKYGLGRAFRVLMDLFTIYFMKTFLTRPMHIFGSFGIVSILISLALSTYLAVIKFFRQADIGNRPLLLFAVVLFIAGIQLLSFGLLAEMMMRTYHESQRRPIYRVREVVGCSAHRDQPGAS
ncbi:glycosyltransferase family 2 protein [Romeria aff. gracilis LEGE 07310]|uniref:Glycosyltransferase family 2 protein n=1 Tax=Vasconcelosia minhoensis LEGE 07310 TaxID=915328 RepID=A0A8J7DE67_9CYAN|nr:glycosyltransferase family 2 protein [Romeria gracilis]MBE9079538.1 glycosyltransferase family 2 protein [Romeria aff. gracilis LEGE 07310]